MVCAMPISKRKATEFVVVPSVPFVFVFLSVYRAHF